MSKLIKGWEELVGLESEHYKLDIEVENGCGWIRPKVETEETENNYWEHHEYLSTHTFYGHHHEFSTKLLQKYGFDVEIDNWDREYFNYTIKRGDYLHHLHKLFKSPLPILDFQNEVLRVNNIVKDGSINKISVGTTLRIPKDICGGKK